MEHGQVYVIENIYETIIDFLEFIIESNLI